MSDKEMLAALRSAREQGLPASTANGCTCDFCTGKKRWEDNWCARCGEVQLVLPKWWENVDVCDECDVAVREEVKLDAARAMWRVEFPNRVAAMKWLLANSVPDETPTPRGDGDEP